MTGFDRIVVVDWSANATPKTGRDSIWIASADADGLRAENPATRDAAMRRLRALLDETLARGQRVLVGFDFPFAYPRGFARALTGTDDPFAVWAELADRVEDGPDNANNRFAVAAGLNALFPGVGPFWGCPAGHDDPRLPAKGTARRDHGMPERRACDRAGGAQPVWKLYTTGSVGSQALMGLPRLHALRRHYGGALSVAPFEPARTPIVLAEVFPSLIAETVATLMRDEPVKDRAQVMVLAAALHGLPGDRLAAMLAEGDPEEGWITGLGHEDALAASARRALGPPSPPPLRNDCFAMPQGVDWVPVDDALRRLRAALLPVAGKESVPLREALGRVLAEDCHALRSNPPQANAAVDGYGFAHVTLGAGPHGLPLVAGRAAAGQPFDGAVPSGHALRILTGAILPEGVDTVVLEEDTAADAATVAFHGPLKPGANTRRAGEDVAEGALALPAGHRLRAPDLALLAALGLGSVSVHRRLRVGVLSTGDEIVADPGAPALPHQIWDANRPMLLALAEGWGFVPVDLGHVRDDPAQIAARLDRGAAEADVILTSGGASAGDEDHVSALLRGRGTLSSWRIAVKPGRPLALALWDGVPVFGLPGNPVAALVCALIFARPALSLLSGAGWVEPRGFTVPAAFSKSKKAGRREFLRARLTAEGAAEVFRSEGSGRISGLSWADGLVELPDEAMQVEPGSPVRFLPYAGLGVV